MKTLTDFDWRGKVAVLRTDLNVPLSSDGSVSDDTRLLAAAESMQAILKAGGSVVVLSHLGRPQEGHYDAPLSLEKIATPLSQALQYPVRFCPSLDGAQAGRGEVLLLENTRFNVGEKANDSNLAQRYAALGDVFVMDAFASAHRAEASVAALAHAGLPTCAGLLVSREMEILQRVLEQVERPLVGIFGGAKISTKLAVLRRMADLCDTLLIGGGMANTLLLAQGNPVGASLVQRDMLGAAQTVLNSGGKRLVLPQDAVIRGGKQLKLDDLAESDEILDIGSATCDEFCSAIAAAKTILWNGPVGLFEQPAYAAGTMVIARAVADSAAYSLIGGGDTIAAARAAGVIEQISYVSTGGGALLEYWSGKTLPGLAALAA